MTRMFSAMRGKMSSKRWLIFVSALIGVMGLSTAARAQEDCPRGTLDKAYCDRNGDLTADLPADPKKIVNPSTLIFAYTPVEDPAVYQKVWDGFLKNLEKVTGKKIVFFPVQSNAAQYEAMRSGRLHIAGVNAGGNALAVNCAGYVPFAMMAAKDNSFGYEMEIIVPADSPIKTPADLKGHKIAFTDATSNSGFKAPSAILKADFNLEAKRDFEPVFSGKHDNSILGVVNKDYEAAAVANSVLNRMIDRKVFEPAKIRSIYKSRDVPDHRLRLRPQPRSEARGEDQGGVLQLPLGGLGAGQAEFKKEGKFIPIDYKKDWAVLRKIDEATGVKYTCK